MRTHGSSRELGLYETSGRATVKFVQNPLKFASKSHKSNRFQAPETTKCTHDQGPLASDTYRHGCRGPAARHQSALHSTGKLQHETSHGHRSDSTPREGQRLAPTRLKNRDRNLACHGSARLFRLRTGNLPGRKRDFAVFLASSSPSDARLYPLTYRGRVALK